MSRTPETFVVDARTFTPDSLSSGRSAPPPLHVTCEFTAPLLIATKTNAHGMNASGRNTTGIKRCDAELCVLNRHESSPAESRRSDSTRCDSSRNQSRRNLWRLLCGVLLVFSFAASDSVSAEENATPEWTAEQLEQFEKQIRPLLIEKCQACHGTEKQEGGLRLDSRAALLTGGETGPAISPGQPEQSELILAISYDPDGYQMPPSGKLADDQIALLTAWVQAGAPWPAEAESHAGAAPPIDVLSRRGWALQSIADPTVPAIEAAATPIDAFLLDQLRQAQLPPASPASREQLLRRVTFTLTGLPPTPAQREAFLSDSRPEAYAELIDRLLASPAYGERWGRHWLDVVRFCETLGHEFDYEIPFAWKYRDYVIRAFNADVPFDQFALEHIAGDLLESPRQHPVTGTNESVLGTGFYWFGQGKHSPVDIRAEQCDLTDNQIDVLSKAFLATTVSCARCHDHKFDPITIKDYYALAGILESSRRHFTDLRPQAPLQTVREQLAERKAAHRAQLLQHTATQLQRLLDDWAEGARILPEDEAAMNALEHPLAPWKRLQALSDPAQFAAEKQTLLSQLQHHAAVAEQAVASAEILADFSTGMPAGWNNPDGTFAVTGATGDFLCGPDPWKPVETLLPPGRAHSGLLTGKQAGVLRSPTFVISGDFLDYHLCRQPGEMLSGEVHNGHLKTGQVHLIIDGFQHIRSPIYGGLSFSIPTAAEPVWWRQHVSKWVGHRAYIEIEDFDDGSLQLDQIRFSSTRAPVNPPLPNIVALLSHAEVDSPAALQQAYRTLFAEAVQTLHKLAETSAADLSALTAEQTVLLNVLLQQQRQRSAPQAAPDWLDQFYLNRTSLISQLGTPEFALCTTEGTPLNSPLLVRGNPGKPAAEVPRRFLTALGGTEEQIPADSTGRLELARAIVADDNPLFDRVIVNRVWKWHFGQGLVATPDDFGHMGQAPSHPELLDYLALEFRRSGRSLKHLHRQLLLTAAYQQSSDLRPQAEQVDPQNRLWHRMPVPRLEGEAIRDSLLLISGQLQPDMYGRSIAPHLTPFMVGRGRPGVSGPVDGAGRRSIYLNVRRNFLSPFFLAFDYPLPLTTTGRRSVSNVPAQALTMMNSEFTVMQSRRWAESLLAAHSSGASSSAENRITHLYLQAFCRQPTADELRLTTEFVTEALQTGQKELDVWADLCHVLVNAKEFMFLR